MGTRGDFFVEPHKLRITFYVQGTEIIKTNLKLNVFGVKLDNYFHHSYFPSLSSMTWTLDYTKQSTLGASVSVHRKVVVARVAFQGWDRFLRVGWGPG